MISLTKSIKAFARNISDNNVKIKNLLTEKVSNKRVFKFTLGSSKVSGSSGSL